MKRTVIFVIFVLAIASCPVHAQYEISYPYLYTDYYDSDALMSFTNFTIPRPTDSYQSVRLRSMSDALGGLLQDDYTDHFINPAFHLNQTSNELSSDIGAVNDGGKFLIGSSFNLSKSSLSAFINLEHLQKSISSSTSSSLWTYGNTIYTTKSETSPKNYGGTLSFLHSLSQDVTLGYRYQYLQSDSINLYETSSTSASLSSPTVPTNITLRCNDYSKTGHLQKAIAGILIRSGTSVFSLQATGIFSTYTLTNLYTRSSFSQPNYRSNHSQDYPTKIQTTTGFFSTEYRTDDDETLHRNYLFHLGLTYYEGSGFFSDYDSVNYSLYQRTTSHSIEGLITDIKIGAAIEKNFSPSFLGVVGFTINFIHNSIDQTENGIVRTRRDTTRTSTPVKSTASGNHSGIEIRFPIGAELELGEYLLFRGGIDPSFKMDEEKTIRHDGQTYSYLYENTDDQNTSQGLALKANFGIGFRHADMGEVNILFSNILTDVNTWSFSCRYFL